jgi:hypothetical protein
MDKSGAHVNDKPNKYLQLQSRLTNEETTYAIVERFSAVRETGSYLLESDARLELFYERIEQVAPHQGAQFPNHLARNLLMATGIGVAMRRRGDTNLRMDLVMELPGSGQGTAEVELGSGILDAPRFILDDIAVLASRYGIRKESILPIVITLSLPNQRSEYWQLIKDIKKVLNVKINSVTLGMLAIFVSNRSILRFKTGEEFYIDPDCPSLRTKIEKALGRKLRITTGYSGLFESEK